MDKINALLGRYGLTLDECHEDWVEKVKNFQSVESTLTDDERWTKENELIENFSKYHQIEEPPEPPKKQAKKQEPKKKKSYADLELNDDIDLSYDKEKAKQRREQRKKRGNSFDITSIFN